MSYERVSLWNKKWRNVKMETDKLNCIKCRPSIGYVSPKILDGNYEGGWNKDYKNSPPTLGSVWIDIHVDSGWGYVKASRLVSPKQLCKECYDARVKELESKMTADMKKEMSQ